VVWLGVDKPHKGLSTRGQRFAAFFFRPDWDASTKTVLPIRPLADAEPSTIASETEPINSKNPPPQSMDIKHRD
jgi:hypothetical protein